MKKSEIKKFSIDELNKKIQSLKKDLFNSRFKKSSGQLTDTAKVPLTKRNIAKMFTELRNREKK